MSKLTKKQTAELAAKIEAAFYDTSPMTETELAEEFIELALIVVDENMCSLERWLVFAECAYKAAVAGLKAADKNGAQ